MNKYLTYRRSIVLAIVLFVSIGASAQKAGQTLVDERNVRAGMGFLASDAMQGRGSGTQFERIAAEYIGSQFMQFGLEPAGGVDVSGKPAYVQTVNMTRGSFSGVPVLKYGSVTLEHGKEMVVVRTTTGSITGGLQKIAGDAQPSKGAAAFVRSASSGDQKSFMPGLQKLSASGASIIIVEETPEVRANWRSIAERKVTFNPGGTPYAIVVVNKDAAAALSAVTEGTQMTFGGELAPMQTRQTWNAAGKIPGTDKTLMSEVVLLSSHLDHLGVRETAPGEDKIFNGADDDASGTVAVLELARVLARAKRQKRTVYFVCFGSEESGGLGAKFFVDNLPFPKEKLIANLQFEMIGRPDAKVKPEELWLTGYERSNLGPELARRGAKLVADPHPEEDFFQRSDNITLAKQGIIAHTVSSYGLHRDYHQASDELQTIDFVHMTRSIDSMVKPVLWLVNSNFVPVWIEGKRP